MSDYRFLKNPAVPIKALIQQLHDECVSNLESTHYLAIHDSSEINLSKHQKRINLNHPGIGRIGSPRKSKTNSNSTHQQGFYIHPTMLVNTQTQSIAGFAGVEIWTRDLEQNQERDQEYPKQSIELKESMKWIQAGQSVGLCLEQAQTKGQQVKATLVSDRESDVYEYFHQRPESVDVLVRVRCDRLIGTPDQNQVLVSPTNTTRLNKAKEAGRITHLYEQLERQALQGTIEVRLEADPRHQRTARTALLEVRYAKVLLLAPKNLKRSAGLEYPALPVFVIEVREDPSGVPDGQEPVLWRLMSTHQVDSLETALQLVSWYKLRWLIELFFAALKGCGLQLEDCLLERGLAVQRLMLLGFPCAAMILQLQRSRENQGLDARIVFSVDEIVFLKRLTPTFEGKTPKQKCSYAQGSLGWAAWVVARLGGWKGYASERPAGVKTFYWGLEKFQAMFEGWKFAQNV